MNGKMPDAFGDASGEAPPLRLRAVSRAFGPLRVLENIDLTVGWGEFVAVVGPSGSGKTTLLNLLSGWDKPSAGTVSRAGELRMVYQSDGLLPWLTVERNIALGLRQAPGGKTERARQLNEMLRLIGLAEFRRSYPHQLSGGMRQRVELARALAGNSDVLLMDEPFSALDYLTRLRMRRELARLLQERPRTVVLVTHDIEEACQLADRVVVLSDRPARIRGEIRLDVPRPRDPTHPQVVEAVENLLGVLGLRGGDSGGGDEPPPAHVRAEEGWCSGAVAGR